MSIRARIVDGAFVALEAGAWLLDTPRRARRWWRQLGDPKLDATEPIPLERRVQRDELRPPRVPRI